MTAQTGRTHPKYLGVFVDNSAGTLTDLSAYLDAPGTFGLQYAEQDVTGMSDAIQNVVVGRPSAPLSIVWQFDTVVMAHFTACDTVAGHNTPMTIDFRMGIRHVWESGEPTFGITSSATSGYVFKDFTTDGIKITTTFNVFGPTAPAFATTAHT